MIIFEDGGSYRWEAADMFEENKWHLDASVEDLVVRGVNLELYGRKYEGKYTIFYNLETGENIARRSRK